MTRWLGILVATLRSCLRTHRELVVENLALRQQLAVWKARQPRPRLTQVDRVFWVLLSRLWANWRHSLQVVRPETVVGWHRRSFRPYWAWKSRRRWSARDWEGPAGSDSADEPRARPRTWAPVRLPLQGYIGRPSAGGESRPWEHKVGYALRQRGLSRDDADYDSTLLWVDGAITSASVIPLMRRRPCLVGEAS